MLLTIILCAGLIGLDQLLKLLAVHYLAPVGTAELIPGVIGLRYTENTGAAFSMFAGRQTLLIVITGIVLLFGAYILLFRRPKGTLEYTAVVMIFSGGVGNLIDRIANGYVVDYIELQFVRFAIFNLADCLVTVGFVLLVVAVFYTETKVRRLKKAEAAADTAASETDNPAQPNTGDGCGQTDADTPAGGRDKRIDDGTD